MLARLLDLIAPPRCVACERAGSTPFCLSCGAEAHALRIDPCHELGCPDAIDSVTARYRYTGVVARAVVAGKIAGATAVWDPLGAELADVLRSADARADVVVPVPTDRRRARSRGIDHTKVLARRVAAELRLPAQQVLRVRTGLADRGAGDHTAPVPTTAVTATCSVERRRVLLIDDVLTTGATASTCASALRSAGAGQIHLAVLAAARGPIVP